MEEKSRLKKILGPVKAAAIGHGLTLLPPRTRLSIQYWRIHHRKLNLAAPTLLTEKIQALKLTNWLADNAHWADKVEAKKHAADILGPEWIVPTLWAGAVLPPRQQRKWATPFFVKASHGSGWNYYVPDEAAKDWDKIERECRKWLTTPWPRHLMERQYDMMQRRILIEPRVGTGDELPPDYKFWVFNGRVEYISITTDRLSGVKLLFVDRYWNRIKTATQGHVPEPEHVPEKPQHMEKMFAAAEKLGGMFPFARVDLYDLPEHPKFGEITFTPASGFETHHPPIELDVPMGAMVDLGKYI